MNPHSQHTLFSDALSFSQSEVILSHIWIKMNVITTLYTNSADRFDFNFPDSKDNSHDISGTDTTPCFYIIILVQ